MVDLAILLTDLSDESDTVDHMVAGRSAESRPPTDKETRQTLVVRVPISEASAKVRTGPPIEDEADLDLEFWGGELPLRTVAGPPVADVHARVPAPSAVTGWARGPQS